MPEIKARQLPASRVPSTGRDRRDIAADANYTSTMTHYANSRKDGFGTVHEQTATTEVRR